MVNGLPLTATRLQPRGPGRLPAVTVIARRIPLQGTAFVSIMSVLLMSA